ncbi:MAG: AMP-binding protein [Cellvibrionaceae bacterium]|nr:AMP-binding protein [Cellvibrionaceae bacterium]
MNTTKPMALLQRELHQPIAYLLAAIKPWGLSPGLVSVEQFLTHVFRVAAVLPDRRYAINLCENRYLFMVAFCAVIVKRGTNLLPPNKNSATQARLQEIYQDIYILHDGIEVLGSAAAICLLTTPLPLAGAPVHIPDVDPRHLAAISFTSGSTGDSTPVLKYWQTLAASAVINRNAMLGELEGTLYQLATVPAQHMWGLETSVLLPLFAQVCVAETKPLFPQDIIDTLVKLPQPAMLVTTPVHLRSLVATVVTVPLSYIFCATSPLTPQLALQAERHFSAELREIYGCSEVGSMAVRRTAAQEHWQRFSAIQFTQGKTGVATVSAEHLTDQVILQDDICLINQDQFTLGGRTGDMVNIAGKRGSVQEVNKVLLSFTGVIDGVVFMPQPQGATTRLAAMVVLADTVSTDKLRQYFRQHLDSAFIPRPILQVDRLPREESGKLPQTKLLAYYERLKNGQ